MKELLNLNLIKNKNFRKEYFKYDFFRFCLYYFSNAFTFKSAEFQKDFCRDLDS
jgi:hypothetical protein